jgi:hypothetical protein
MIDSRLIKLPTDAPCGARLNRRRRGPWARRISLAECRATTLAIHTEMPSVPTDHPAALEKQRFAHRLGVLRSSLTLRLPS